jgi:hypothetical protein
MKKTLIIAAAMASLVLLSPSCQKNAGLSKQEQSLSLHAPSGQRIAATVHDLKTHASAIVENKFGKGQDFQLMRIDYLPVEKGYAAIVFYELKNGTIGNYGIFSGVSYDLAASDETAVQEEDSKVTISCDKKGTCDCNLSGTYNPNTGVVTVNCGCSTCEVKVTESD